MVYITTIFEYNESLSFRLTKQVWQAGDVAKLKIIITNNTNVNVSKITIKVGEFFSLIKKKKSKLCYTGII